MLTGQIVRVVNLLIKEKCFSDLFVKKSKIFT